MTDELARELGSQVTGMADLREKLLEAERQQTVEDTADRVNEALSKAVSDILDVEVPESIIRDVASNEYQAQLLEAQAKVGKHSSGCQSCWQKLRDSCKHADCCILCMRLQCSP